jgi:hypothetical protein
MVGSGINFRKGRRVATAVGFLAGMLACLNALRDAKVAWPPDAAWSVMPHAQRLEMGAGITMILAALVVSVIRPGS